MDETIVRLARTLASVTRLRIVSYLTAHGEQAPSRLARQLRLSPSALSLHLSRLTSAGLLTRRRSGAWSFCAAHSASTPATLGGRTSAWLTELLKHPRQMALACGLHEVRQLAPTEVERRLHGVIFEAATAFTDLRRLQILHRLSQTNAATGLLLGQKLQMSSWAVERHTAKLVRRGFVERYEDGADGIYSLATACRTPVHAELWALVRWAWRD